MSDLPCTRQLKIVSHFWSRARRVPGGNGAAWLLNHRAMALSPGAWAGYPSTLETHVRMSWRLHTRLFWFSSPAYCRAPFLRRLRRMTATIGPPTAVRAGEPAAISRVWRRLRIITKCASRSRRYSRWLCPVQIFIDIPDIPIHPNLQRNRRSKMRQPCRHRRGQEGAIPVRGE